MAARRPDAVVLDLGLTDMDAFEVARTIRADYKGTALLLIHPPDWTDMAVIRGFQVSADFQVVKPCLDDLTRMLARVFESWERYGRP
jgi:DNA-binding response OmpR family regulator